MLLSTNWQFNLELNTKKTKETKPVYPLKPLPLKLIKVSSSNIIQVPAATLLSKVIIELHKGCISISLHWLFLYHRCLFGPGLFCFSILKDAPKPSYFFLRSVRIRSLPSWWFRKRLWRRSNLLNIVFIFVHKCLNNPMQISGECDVYFSHHSVKTLNPFTLFQSLFCKSSAKEQTTMSSAKEQTVLTPLLAPFKHVKVMLSLTYFSIVTYTATQAFT